jgi:hypothetical protein
VSNAEPLISCSADAEGSDGRSTHESVAAGDNRELGLNLGICGLCGRSDGIGRWYWLPRPLPYLFVSAGEN